MYWHSSWPKSLLGATAMLLALLLAAPATAQDSSNVNRVAEIYDRAGSLEHLTIEGDYAYMATHLGGVHVLDVSDPATTNRVAVIDVDSVALATARDIDDLYVAEAENGLSVYDVSTPTDPTKIGSWDSEGAKVNAVAVGGAHAYVSVGSEVKVLDIIQPSAPLEVASVSLDGEVNNVAAPGSHIYVSDESGKVTAYDVTDPLAPQEEDSYDTGFGGGIGNLDVEGVNVFAAASYDGMVVLDASDPANLTLLNDSAVPYKVDALQVDGNYAYLGSSEINPNDPTISIWDISSPDSPTELGGHPELTGRSNWVAVDGDHAYVLSSEQKVAVFSVISPPSPTVETVYNARGYVWTVETMGDYAIALSNYGNLDVIDVADPLNPAEAVTLPLDGSSKQALAVNGDHVYATSNYIGLYTIDLSNPAAPTQVDIDSIYGRPTSMVREENTLYLNDEDGPLHIYDVSTPSDPSQLTSMQSMYASDLAVNDDRLYALVSGGMAVYDVSDPANPSQLTVFGALSGYATLTVDGDVLYAASSLSQALATVDISDPANPALVNEMTDTPGTATFDMDVVNDRLFLYGQAEGFRVLDVSSPGTPTEVGYYDNVDPSELTVMGAVEGDYAYVAEYSHFSVMDISGTLPEQPELVAVTLDAGDEVTVPRGGAFAYDVTVTSNLTRWHDVDVWAIIEDPNNTQLGPIWTVNDIPMGPNTQINAQDIGQTVPFDAETGEYTMTVMSGIRPFFVAGEDQFSFEVVPVAGPDDGTGHAEWAGMNQDRLQPDEVVRANENAMPDEFALGDPYPNPFNPTTRVNVTLPESAELRIEVVNVMGRTVAVLENGTVAAGDHTYAVDGSDWASGVYLIHASVPGHLEQTRKVMLTK